MMKRLLVVLAVLSCRSAAGPEGKTCSTQVTENDLTGIMMIFPEDSTANYAKLLPKKEGPYSNLSVCLTYNTDAPDEFILFSMATPRVHNAFVIGKKRGAGPFEVFVNDKKVLFHKAPQGPLSWIHLCTTWDSSTGLVQLWVDGQPSVKKLASKGFLIQATPIIILGQEQESYGDRFDRDMTFVGHLSDLHVWDRVLQPCEVEQAMGGFMSRQGNVLDWGALELEIFGNVVLESRQSTNATAHTGPCLLPGKQ
ncbi:hypothetical protein SKAU_G00108130 [Synaphobranchus kaupii]|uniref:C-reactive protein n=1 Tax=Synaphobranchus kaupii TaxID=118154 RepID=A0A9Q1J5Y3_SYNKA|nr:hypothetical protein SKAU_G00108130 [Synaphobranchus kaupii]